MYFVGVDAGGTKTLFILTDEHGRLLARSLRGGGAFFDKGAEGLSVLVSEGISALCGLTGIRKEDITAAGLGFPGYGEMEGSEQIITSLCEQIIGVGRVVCECDCYIGWAGSLGMEAGINVIAGTGANCYGVNAEGDAARSSGWGTFCDEGSCHWLGRRLIQTYARQSDGRIPRTPLYEIMRTRLSIQKDTDFIHTINHHYGQDAAKTAGLQRLLKEIYDNGDPCAAALYQEAAAELALAAEATARKLGLSAGYKVSYSGGLFQSGDCILHPLKSKVSESGGQLTAPRFTPEQGAVLAAMRHTRSDWDFSALAFNER